MSGSGLGEFSKASVISSPFSISDTTPKAVPKQQQQQQQQRPSGCLKQWSFPRDWKLKLQASKLIPYPYKDNCMRLRTDHISVYESSHDGSVEFTFTEATGSDTNGVAVGGGTYVITKNMLGRFINAKNLKIAKEFKDFVDLHTNTTSRVDVSSSKATAAATSSPVQVPATASETTQQKRQIWVAPPEKKRSKTEESSQAAKQDAKDNNSSAAGHGAGGNGNQAPPRKETVPFPTMVVVEDHAAMVSMIQDIDRQFLRTMASNPLSNVFMMSGTEVRIELNRQFAEQKAASRASIPRIGIVP